MRTGDRIIRKMMNGINMGSPAFLREAERLGWVVALVRHET
jgi:hypothetical protein